MKVTIGYVDAVENAGGIRAAAREMGIPYSTFHGAYVKELAAYYGAKSVTLRHDKDSNEMRPYYLKTDSSKLDVAAELSNFDFSTVKPSEIKPHVRVKSKTAFLIPVCDLHIGNQCYKSQNNDADWNLDIVKKEYPAAIAELLGSDNYDVIVCAFNGDWMHFDSAVRAETPVSGHNLSSSGYFGDIVKTSLELSISTVEKALSHCNTVYVSTISGNHDEASGYWQDSYIRAYFRNEKRVKFLDKKVQMTSFVYGNSSVYFFHGDKLKYKQAPQKLPAIFPETYGNKYKYGISGHYHHLEVKEDDGFTNIMINSLCPNDDYSAKGCYISRRCLTGLTLDYGKGVTGFKFSVPE